MQLLCVALRLNERIIFSLLRLLMGLLLFREVRTLSPLSTTSVARTLPIALKSLLACFPKTPRDDQELALLLRSRHLSQAADTVCRFACSFVAI